MNLAKLNSATKYPSILTYHEAGDRGRLKDVVQVPFPAGQPIYVTEKVDGTNGRIVMLPDGPRAYIIGSREEFLFAQGDLIWNTTYDIKTVLEPIAERLSKVIKPSNGTQIVVYFFEIYGAGLPSAKQYTNGKTIAARLFDVASVPLEILEKPIEKISSWRDYEGQRFWTGEKLDAVMSDLARTYSVSVERVPFAAEAQSLPTSIAATYEWLKQFERSRCDLGGGKGRAEGVVVRTADRKTIAKLRFEDYERTLGVKRK